MPHWVTSEHWLGAAGGWLVQSALPVIGAPPPAPELLEPAPPIPPLDVLVAAEAPLCPHADRAITRSNSAEARPSLRTMSPRYQTTRSPRRGIAVGHRDTHR